MYKQRNLGPKPKYSCSAVPMELMFIFKSLERTVALKDKKEEKSHVLAHFLTDKYAELGAMKAFWNYFRREPKEMYTLYLPMVL